MIADTYLEMSSIDLREFWQYLRDDTQIAKLGTIFDQLSNIKVTFNSPTLVQLNFLDLATSGIDSMCMRCGR